MLRNYLAAALRNLWRNRAYASINVLGLAVGFAAAILIALYVRDEYSYDRFFPGYRDVYLLTQTENMVDRRLLAAQLERLDERMHERRVLRVLLLGVVEPFL